VSNIPKNSEFGYIKIMQINKNYVEFLISPSGLSMTAESRWECRNAGLLKIMTRVFENLQETNLLSQEYTIRINTADGPSKDKRTKTNNYIEFDTSTDSIKNINLFPDYIFGNWWHIGLTNFDKFTQDIISNNNQQVIKNNRIFWMGNLQGVPQRIRYLELSKEYPDILYGDQMGWIDQGRTPTKFISTKDHCDFKYLIDLSGQGVSGRLKLLPFCDRPLFLADRRLWAWSDIVIENSKLYISVKSDLSDLIDKYRWAEENQDIVKENSRRLLDLCKQNFTFSKICERATELIINAMEALKKKSTQKKMKFDVVVAHYAENLDWLDRLDHECLNRIFVYSKGRTIQKLDSEINYIQLPNVGRESHTYLWHCINQYENMKSGDTDFVFFVQGSPHGMDDRRIPEWIDNVINYGLDHTYNFRNSSPYDFLNQGRCLNWHGHENEPAKYDVKEWCDNIIKPVEKFRDIPIFWNACFGVSAERILSNDKTKYQSILKELETPNPESGHYCERLWYYIFNMDECKNKVIEDCYDFWGDHDARRHHGIMKLNKDGTIGLYNHFNESFWKMDGDAIILMDKNGKATSVLNKIAEGQYVGNFISDPRSIHKLIKLN